MGKPVDNLGGGGDMYAALGGLTDMASLVDGVERMEMVEHAQQPALQGPQRRAVEGGMAIAPRGAARGRGGRGRGRGAVRADVSAFDLYMRPHQFA